MSLQVKQNNAELVPFESESKIVNCMGKIDIFKYVPVPKLYPVSTTCSRIGSLLFIIFLVGFFIFSMYAFFALNIPVTNAIPIQTDGYFPMNNISFNLIYYNGSDDYYPQILNDSSIVTMKLTAKYLTQSINIPLISCKSDMLCPDVEYLAQLQKNQEFPVELVNQNNQLQLYYASGNKLRYYLSVYICMYGPTCLPFDQITQILQNSVLNVEIFEAKGYNYQTGTPINSATYYYQYLLSTSTNALTQLTFQQTIFKYQPNLLTTFKERQTSETKMVEEIALVNPYPSSKIAVIRFVPDGATNVVTIAPKTIVETLSLWFSFTKMIITAGLIIFVGWNRKKFDKANPEWNRFENIFEAPKKEQQQKQFEMYDIKNKNQPDTDQSQNNSDRLNIRETLTGDIKGGMLV